MTIRIEELTVGDVMSPAPYCLASDTTLACALKVLAELQLSGAPVLDREGAVVGVISTSDLLGPVEQIVEGRLDPATLRGLHVGILASRPALTVHPDQPLVEACKVMARTGVHRLVATNGHGVPVGVISSWDAAAALGRLEAMSLEVAPRARSW